MCIRRLRLSLLVLLACQNFGMAMSRNARLCALRNSKVGGQPNPCEEATVGGTPCGDNEVACDCGLLAPADETNCATASCDFENNSTCGWKLGRSSQKWGWKPTTGNLEFGRKDHTTKTGEGYFLFANISGARRGSSALFSTPPIEQNAESCEFVFHKYVIPGTVGIFQLLLRSRDNQSVPRELFSKDLSTVPKSETNTWMKHGITWPKSNQVYTLSFELSIPSFNSSPVTGGIGIDDLEFRNCGAPTKIPSTSDRPSCADVPCEELAGKARCVDGCRCGDHPPLTCGKSRKCQLDSASLMQTCRCRDGQLGPRCERKIGDRLTSGGPSPNPPLLSFFIGMAVFSILTTSGYAIYKIILKNRRSSNSNRVNSENGFDVTFFIDTPPILQDYANGSGGGILPRSEISNCSYFVLDKEWAYYPQ